MNKVSQSSITTTKKFQENFEIPNLILPLSFCNIVKPERIHESLFVLENVYKAW